jgi:hypothetical protein
MKSLFVSLALTLSSPFVVAQCTIAPSGNSLMQNGLLTDGWTAAVPIGFSFTFAGSTYTDMYLSDHGLCALNNMGVPIAPPNNAFVYTPLVSNLGSGGMPLLAPFYSDHSLTYGTNDGEIYIDNDNGGTHCTVTWHDVETYIDGAPFTFQMTLYPTGKVTYRWDSRTCNEGSTFGALNAIVGMSPDMAAAPAPTDISSSPVSLTDELYEEFVTTAALTCNPLFDLADTACDFIPTNPGWVVIPRTLNCAGFSSVGAGCDGLALGSTAPELGTNWVLTTTGLSVISPAGITFFSTASNAVGVPLNLIGINSPGCNAYLGGSLLGSADAANIAGESQLFVGVPGNAALLGSGLTAQSVGLSLALPGLVATSNTIDVVFGN